MFKISRKLLGKLNIVVALGLTVTMAGVLSVGTYVFASATSSFTQAITGGSLSVDIVDASYVTVASPAVAMASKAFSVVCQSSTGTFGTATEQIYVQNPGAAAGGWDVSLAGSATTAVWDGAATDFDFNDPTTSGCTDGADTDSVGGQMTVNAAAGTLAVGQCAACDADSVTKGASSAFSEGTTDSITIITGAAGSDDVGDWKLTGVAISQTIPAEQAVASDYDISLVLSIVAKS